MLGKRIINTATGAGAACTTDTVQILDGVPFDSIATYEFESDATNSLKSSYMGDGAAVFNGSSSYINLGTISSSDLSSNYSFSFWVNPSEINSNNGRFLYLNNNTSGSGQYLFLYQNSTNNVRVGTNLFTQFNSNFNSFSVGDWVHIALTVSPTNVILYINGVEDTNISQSTTAISINQIAILGADTLYTNNYNGKIDQVRIYNTALTQSDVDTLYAETASSTISISGLLAHYKLEGDATDETGNYDGTASNITYNEYDGIASNVTYAAGKFGNAAVFNGTSSGINLPSSTPISNQINGTVSLWFNVLNNTKKETLIRFANNDEVLLRINTNGTLDLIGVRQSNNSYISYTTTGSYNDGAWHHLVMTRESGSIKFYIDNSLDNTLSWNNTFVTASNESAIGWDGFSTASILSGKIDQVRIYDKALSAANVATLYAETVATASTNISLNTPSGVAYYKMNDATDETGSYDGTATNVNFNVAGKFGNAASFNGSNSKITTSLSVNTANPITYSFWIKPNTENSYVTFAAAGTTDTSTLLFQKRGDTNAARLIWFNWPTIPLDLNDTTPMEIGVWTHYAFTLDGSVANLYKNGVNTVSNVSYSSTYVFPNFTLGQRPYTPSEFFNGSIDQVRIFDKAITSDEVETLYDEVQCIPTIVPTDYFNTTLYTGDDTNTSYTRDITGVGFDPDFVWIKDRDNGGFEHVLFDSVRGAGSSKVLSSDTTGAEGWTSAAPMSAFIDDGFSVQPRSPWNANNLVNKNGEDFVAWNWKAGGTAVSNTDGTITSQVSANTDAGFSVVEYTGNSTAGATVGHGLYSPPELIMYKRTDVGANWIIKSSVLGVDNYLIFGTDQSFPDSGVFWNSTLPNSSVFTLGNSASVNVGNYIAYCFHSVEGYSKIGSYVGSSASNSIVTGFRPAFVMIKRTNLAGGRWIMVDDKRGVGGFNVAKILNAQDSLAEFTASTYGINFHSNGFSIPAGASGNINSANNSYIFMAFAEEVFNPNGVTRNATDPFGDNSELALYKFEDNANDSEGNYNGTFTNPSYATGYIDKAAVFNGSSSYVSASNPLSGFSASGNYSVSVWVNVNSTSATSGGTIFGSYVAPSAYPPHIWITTSTLRAHGYQILDFSNNLSTGTWYNIVLVNSGTNTSMYINGNLQTPASTTTWGPPPAGDFVIGGLPHYFDGQIDQVRIFDRALDSGEVTQLYNE